MATGRWRSTTVLQYITNADILAKELGVPHHGDQGVFLRSCTFLFKLIRSVELSVYILGDFHQMRVWIWRPS